MRPNGSIDGVREIEPVCRSIAMRVNSVEAIDQSILPGARGYRVFGLPPTENNGQQLRHRRAAIDADEGSTVTGKVVGIASGFASGSFASLWPFG